MAVFVSEETQRLQTLAGAQIAYCPSTIVVSIDATTRLKDTENSADIDVARMFGDRLRQSATLN